jgi:protein-disulfide isomerase
MKRNHFLTLIAVTSGLVFSTLTYADNSFVIGGNQQASQPASGQNVSPQYINSLFHQAGDPIAGNPKGTVTIVEFFDYRCIHCVNMSNVMSALIHNNSNLRVVFKELPIFGDVSIYAAKAALAAKMQGKYVVFHEALMRAGKGLTPEKVIAVAETVGLDTKKLTTDMASNSVEQEIQNNARLADSLQINGTPAFVIGKTHSNNAKLILGEIEQQTLQNSITKLAK